MNSTTMNAMYITKSLVENWDSGRTSKPAIKLENRQTEHGFLWNLQSWEQNSKVKDQCSVSYQRDGYVRELNVNTENNLKKYENKIKEQTILAVKISFPTRVNKPRPSHAARRCAVEISGSTKMA